MADFLQKLHECKSKNAHVLASGVEEKIRFVPLAERYPDEKLSADVRKRREQAHAAVVAVILDAEAVPIREVAGIVAGYALKRQLRHFAAICPPVRSINGIPLMFNAEILSGPDVVKKLVECAPDYLQPGDIVHAVGSGDLLSAHSYMITSTAQSSSAPTDAKTQVSFVRSIEEVSAELTKMGLTFDALDEVGMYRLSQKEMPPAVTWTILTPTHLSWVGMPRKKPDTSVFERLPANNGAAIKFERNYMLQRTPKKDTRI